MHGDTIVICVTAVLLAFIWAGSRSNNNGGGSGE